MSVQTSKTPRIQVKGPSACKRLMQVLVDQLTRAGGGLLQLWTAAVPWSCGRTPYLQLQGQPLQHLLLLMLLVSILPGQVSISPSTLCDIQRFLVLSDYLFALCNRKVCDSLGSAYCRLSECLSVLFLVPGSLSCLSRPAELVSISRMKIANSLPIFAVWL